MHVVSVHCSTPWFIVSMSVREILPHRNCSLWHPAQYCVHVAGALCKWQAGRRPDVPVRMLKQRHATRLKSARLCSLKGFRKPGLVHSSGRLGLRFAEACLPALEKHDSRCSTQSATTRALTTMIDYCSPSSSQLSCFSRPASLFSQHGPCSVDVKKETEKPENRQACP